MNNTPDDRKSALFASLVLQQSNLAMMFLGKVPHPEEGKPVRDLESARTFIDQLEILAEKTRGNLTPDEDRLMKGVLTSLRLSYVEATGEPSAAPAPEPKADAPSEPGDAGAHGSEPGATGPDEESRKRFTKKY